MILNDDFAGRSVSQRVMYSIISTRYVSAVWYKAPYRLSEMGRKILHIEINCVGALNSASLVFRSSSKHFVCSIDKVSYSEDNGKSRSACISASA